MVWKGKPASVITGSRDQTHVREKKKSRYGYVLSTMLHSLTAQSSVISLAAAEKSSAPVSYTRADHLVYRVVCVCVYLLNCT